MPFLSENPDGCNRTLINLLTGDMQSHTKIALIRLTSGELEPTSPEAKIARDALKLSKRINRPIVRLPDHMEAE